LSARRWVELKHLVFDILVEGELNHPGVVRPTRQVGSFPHHQPIFKIDPKRDVTFEISRRRSLSRLAQDRDHAPKHPLGRSGLEDRIVDVRLREYLSDQKVGDQREWPARK
jgi:hypothetical protein